MRHRWAKMSWTAIALLLASALSVSAQQSQRDYDSNNGRADDVDNYRSGEARDVRIDRYLDADVWTDRSDAEYYEGDAITIHFRVNRDAFVAVYSIDSRGRVNLIFPSDPSDDNFVTGGVTYNLPDGRDNYDLVVSGPKGTENLQIIASRERFPIPNWYRNSGLICDWEDRNEYMDDLNGRYFVRYDGQRFAYDRAAILVDEWEPDYFHPIYTPYYPGWAVCGNVYIDYPWGGAVYVNGIYWGCAPLYIPRLLVGWHTLTVYDPWGYCWENDVHVSRYNTLILDRTIIKTRQTVVSKYKEVRTVGYRDPAKNGYPDYDKRAQVIKSKTTRTESPVIGSFGAGKQKTNITRSDDVQPVFEKKFVRGDAKVVQTDRGIETNGTVTYKDRGQRSTDANTNSFGNRKGADRRDGSTTTIDNQTSQGKSTRTNQGSNTVRQRTTETNNGNTATTRRKSGSTTTQPSTTNRQPAIEKRQGGETRKADRPAEQPKAKPAETKQSNPPAVKEKPAQSAPAPAPAPSSGDKSKRGHGRG